MTDDQIKQLNRLQAPQLTLDASRLSVGSKTALASADEVSLFIDKARVTAPDIDRLDELGVEFTFQG
ncbi:MAG: hypothetical protein P8N76_21555 [Pirellulaceae bacterium]|nr:hypothetical protein [Pirellulaceae bacterium]